MGNHWSIHPPEYHSSHSTSVVEQSRMMKKSGEVTSTYFVFLFLLHFTVHPTTVHAVQPEILDAPMNVTLALGEAPVTMTCRVRGDDLFIRVNDIIPDHRNFPTFRERGITFSSVIHVNGVANQSATVEISEPNNNTRISCIASSEDFGHVVSDTATLIIAGAPSPPGLHLVVVDVYTLQVQWGQPFTTQGFPITRYLVSVTTTTDTEAVLADEVLDADVLTFSITETGFTNCTNLTFSVRAENSIGTSVPGTINGAFPLSPGDFLVPPSSEVTFPQDRSPVVQLIFTLPYLCPYNNATYLLVVENESGMAVATVGPSFYQWFDSAASINVEIRGRLLLNKDYTVNITVWNLGGQSALIFNFSTRLPPTAATSPVDTTQFLSTSPVDTTQFLSPAATSPAIEECHVAYKVIAVCLGCYFVWTQFGLQL